MCSSETLSDSPKVTQPELELGHKCFNKIYSLSLWIPLQDSTFKMANTFKRNITFPGIKFFYIYICNFPGGSDSKASAYNMGDLGSIPGLGRSPGEGNGNPLQYSCLENPMDGGAW